MSLFSCFATLLLGCSTTDRRTVTLPPSVDSETEVIHPFQKPPEVIKVNTDWNYAVVEDQNMPEEGRKGDVIRNEQVVGTVEASAQRRPPFLTAGILEGSIQRGDTVRWKLPARGQ